MIFIYLTSSTPQFFYDLVLLFLIFLPFIISISSFPFLSSRSTSSFFYCLVSVFFYFYYFNYFFLITGFIYFLIPLILISSNIFLLLNFYISSTFIDFLSSFIWFHYSSVVLIYGSSIL